MTAPSMCETTKGAGAKSEGAIDFVHRDVVPGEAPGRRARLGLLLLATDYVTEREAMDMIPRLGPGGDDLAWFTSRVPNANPVTVANLRAMAGELERAAATILPGDRLDALAYSCTSGTLAMGIAETRAHMAAARPGVPATTPPSAIRAAFKALGVRRLAVLAPYTAEVNRLIADFLTGDGFEIVAYTAFDLDSDPAMSGVTAADIAAAGAAADRPEAEALFISCTALRAVGCIAPLEARLGKPVVTSNQALFWHALRLAGVNGALAGHGRLLDLTLDGHPCSEDLA